MTTWKTVIPKKPLLGDKLSLPTLVGMANFTVTRLDDKSGDVESGNLLGRIRLEDGEWTFNHCLIDKNMTVTGIVVDQIPPKPNSNVGFRKEYK